MDKKDNSKHHFKYVGPFHEEKLEDKSLNWETSMVQDLVSDAFSPITQLILLPKFAYIKLAEYLSDSSN